MAESKQVREIEIRVNTRGNPEIKKLATEFSKFNKGVREVSSSLNTLKNAFFAIQGLSFAGIGLGELINAADAMQKLTDRLVLSEGSLEAANIQLAKLGEVANSTNSRIEDVATVYSRLNLSLRDAGVSSEALLATTQALQNTFRLSGATASEATAATIQLSQGLASGQVRGQELRSVLEQNALIGEILAKKLGIARGELLKFAEKNGGIKAADVLGAIADNFQNIEERASKLQPTIREGLDTAFNDLKLSLNELNQTFKVTEKAVSSIKFLAENLQGLFAILAAFGTYAALPKLIAGIGIVAGKLGTIVGGLIAGFTALVAVANPLTIALTALGASIAAIFGTATLRSGVLSDTFKGLGDSLNKDLFPNVQKFLYYLSEIGVKADQTVVKTENFANQAKSLIEDISGANTPRRSIFDLDAIGPLEQQIKSLKDAETALKNSGKEIFDFKAELTKLNNIYNEGKLSVASYSSQLKQLEIKKVRQEFLDGSFGLEEYNKKLKEINDGKSIKSTKEFELNLKSLNAEFSSGKVTIQEYARALDQAEMKKINRDFKEGKENVFELNQAVRQNNLKLFNQALAEGATSISQYKDSVAALEMGKLNEELKTGVITLEEYDKKLISVSEKFQPGSSLRSGVEGYLASSGTLSENIAKSIENTFNRLEDVLFDFIKTGRFAFSEFTQAILDDLTKIIIRAAIIRPLASGILDTAGLDSASAKGNVFDKGLKKFASGGVVSSPTLFNYGNGKRGLMGEAGPEVIAPLKRDSKGNMGVSAVPSNVVVNVINQSTGQAEVTQQERTNSDGSKVIDIIIKNKIRESLADGSLDRAMNTNYGVKRQRSG